MADDEEREARRKKLYEELWAEPATTVAKRYGVSGRAVAKWCEQLCVPVPTRGHWAKPAGRRPKRTPLGRFVEQPRKKAPPRPTSMSAEQGARAASFARPREGATPHPLVTATRAFLARSSKLAHTPNGMMDGCDEGCLHLRSSEASLDRVLRLYDLVLRALERRGFTFETTRTGTLIRVGEGNPLHLRIAERYTQKPIKAGPAPGLSGDERRILHDLQRHQAGVEGTGLLVLGLGPHRPDPIMHDDNRRLLEDRVEDLAERAVAMNQREAERRVELDKRIAARRVEERARDESRRVAGAEASQSQARIAWVHRHLEGRRVARECREAAQELLGLCVSLQLDVVPGSKLHDAVAVLQQHADDVDPTTSVRRDPGGWVSIRGEPS